MLLETGGGVTVGPVHDDVLRVTLAQLVPLLSAEHVEIEVIELGEIELGGFHRRFERGQLGHLFAMASLHGGNDSDRKQTEHERANDSHNPTSFPVHWAVPLVSSI
jgi:hypothetical protein